MRIKTQTMAVFLSKSQLSGHTGFHNLAFQKCFQKPFQKILLTELLAMRENDIGLVAVAFRAFSRT